MDLNFHRKEMEQAIRVSKQVWILFLQDFCMSVHISFSYAFCYTVNI